MTVPCGHLLRVLFFQRGCSGSVSVFLREFVMMMVLIVLVGRYLHRPTSFVPVLPMRLLSSNECRYLPDQTAGCLPM